MLGHARYIRLAGKLNDALAVLAIKHRGRLSGNQAIIRQNLATATAWVDRHADLVSWTPPRGGCYLLRYHLDIRRLIWPISWPKVQRDTRAGFGLWL
jgi:hypothetical protein